MSAHEVDYKYEYDKTLLKDAESKYIYIPHLKKWRGTLIVDGEVYDTELYDTIFEAIK